MQARERQLHFGLHAYRARHPAPSRLPGHVTQQHGLAHARVAAHHQAPALARPDRLDKPVEHLAFAAPVRQPIRASPGHWEPTGPGWTRTITPPPSRLEDRLAGPVAKSLEGPARAGPLPGIQSVTWPVKQGNPIRLRAYQCPAGQGSL